MNRRRQRRQLASAAERMPMISWSASDLTSVSLAAAAAASVAFHPEVPRTPRLHLSVTMSRGTAAASACSQSLNSIKSQCILNRVSMNPSRLISTAV